MSDRPKGGESRKMIIFPTNVNRHGHAVRLSLPLKLFRVVSKQRDDVPGDFAVSSLCKASGTVAVATLKGVTHENVRLLSRLRDILSPHCGTERSIHPLTASFVLHVWEYHHKAEAALLDNLLSKGIQKEFRVECRVRNAEEDARCGGTGKISDTFSASMLRTIYRTKSTYVAGIIEQLETFPATILAGTKSEPIVDVRGENKAENPSAAKAHSRSESIRANREAVQFAEKAAARKSGTAGSLRGEDKAENRSSTERVSRSESTRVYREATRLEERSAAQAARASRPQATATKNKGSKSGERSRRGSSPLVKVMTPPASDMEGRVVPAGPCQLSRAVTPPSSSSTRDVPASNSANRERSRSSAAPTPSSSPRKRLSPTGASSTAGDDNEFDHEQVHKRHRAEEGKGQSALSTLAAHGGSSSDAAAARTAKWMTAVEENDNILKMEQERLRKEEARAKEAHLARSLELYRWTVDEHGGKHSGTEGPPPMEVPTVAKH